jgi:hypothetical protein
MVFLIDNNKGMCCWVRPIIDIVKINGAFSKKYIYK